MNSNQFISEHDVKTFEGWLKYQAIDPASLTAAELATWRSLYEATRELADAQPQIGLMRLKPMKAGERRIGVAVREGPELWLTLWARRSHRGEWFVMVPRGTQGWDPHTSYHLDGTLHVKSYGQKFSTLEKRQPLTGDFKGAVHLGAYAGHAPKSEGAICHPGAFTAVVEVPSGLLGPRHGQVTVDLVEPGCNPHEHVWTEIHTREVLKDAIPWVIITVGR